MNGPTDSPAPVLAIGDRRIGTGEPCFVIAEAGVNHNGSLEMARRLVDCAVAAGADAVKFQKRHLASLYPEALLRDPNLGEWSFHYLLPFLKETEFSDEEFIGLRGYCRERGIRFLCTPWDLVSLDLLEQLELEAYKVSSADLVNFPLLEAIAATGKPMILSTGMATWREIETTVEHLRALSAQFALLHCVSAYPAPFEALNMRFLERLKELGAPVGYSGHERGISVPVIAVTLGACIIEKHLTMDRTLPGPDHAASLEPQGFAKLVRDIRIAETALGRPEKHLCQIELINRHVLRKSLVASRDLGAGEMVTLDAVKACGPGKGISPQRIGDLVGVTLQRQVACGELFTEGDLKAQEDIAIERSRLRRPWGLKCRFHDLERVLALEPEVVELHFSQDDLENDLTPPPTRLRQRLVVHAPEFFDRRLVDLAAEDDDRRQASIEFLQRTIDRTARLAEGFSGTAAVVIHVGGMSMDHPDPRHDRLMSRAVDAFHRLEPRGLTLLPENLPPRPWYFGGQWFQNVFIRSEEMVEFCRELDLGMTLDVSHAQLYCTASGADLSEFVRRCLPLSRHLHLADASGIDGEGLQIGEGVVPWESVLELLQGAEFSWVPEIWSGHHRDFAGFREAINRLVALGGL